MLWSLQTEGHKWKFDGLIWLVSFEEQGGLTFKIPELPCSFWHDRPFSSTNSQILTGLKIYSDHYSLFQPFMESLIDKENPGEEILLVFYDGIKMTVRRQESWENNFWIILKSEKFFKTKWWRNDSKRKSL